MQKVEGCVGNYLVASKFRNVSDQFEWAFASLYGTNSDVDRWLLWEEMVGLISWWDLPWIGAILT